MPINIPGKKNRQALMHTGGSGSTSFQAGFYPAETGKDGEDDA